MKKQARKNSVSKKSGAKRPNSREGSLAEFLAKSPLRGSGIQFPRVKGSLRAPDLDLARRNEILSLFGTIEYDEEYDYKKERQKRK